MSWISNALVLSSTIDTVLGLEGVDDRVGDLFNIQFPRIVDNDGRGK